MTNWRSLPPTLNSPCFTSSVPVFLPLSLHLYFSSSLIFQKVMAILDGDDIWENSGGDGLTVNVSDQVCEAEKDEDGHALNLKGENYFSSSGSPTSSHL